MDYPQTIREHNEKIIWKYEDCFKIGNKFNLVRCYMHTVDQILGMHSHSFYEINIVLTGEGRHYIEDKSCVAKAGMVFILPPDIRHGYYCEDIMRVYHILISRAFINRFSNELSSLDGYPLLFEIEPLLRGEYEQNLFLTLEQSELDARDDIFNYLKKTDSLNDTNVQIARNATVLKIISEFCSLAAKKQGIKNISQPNAIEIIKSMEYLNENSSEKHDFAKIASDINMSYTTYLRFFKQVCGKTPGDYLMLCKINKAKHLLEFSDQSIVEVAMACGFFDSSHFVKTFKRFTGLNPKQFRQLKNTQHQTV